MTGPRAPPPPPVRRAQLGLVAAVRLVLPPPAGRRRHCGIASEAVGGRGSVRAASRFETAAAGVPRASRKPLLLLTPVLPLPLRRYSVLFGRSGFGRLCVVVRRKHGLRVCEVTLCPAAAARLRLWILFCLRILFPATEVSASETRSKRRRSVTSMNVNEPKSCGLHRAWLQSGSARS